MASEEQRAQARLGMQARQVLDNQAFAKAMAQLKEEVVTAWKAAPVRDVEGQRLLLQLAKLTDKFETILIGMVDAGKFAQDKIDLDELRNEGKARQLLRKVL